MLEKIFYCDAHFHLSSLSRFEEISFPEKWTGCTSCHSESDFLFSKDSGAGFPLSFGIHPQSPERNLLAFLEELLEKGKISAVGECGFDLYTEEYRTKLQDQKIVFENQLELALKYNKPLVIHSRKGNHLLFEYSHELKKLPAVLFHSFMGSLVEAESFLKRGIVCYFSFGKQILNGNKKAIEIVSKIPLQNLLLETDAPFQFLKGEKYTPLSDIQKVYGKAADLRGEKDMFMFSESLYANFRNFYGSL